MVRKVVVMSFVLILASALSGWAAQQTTTFQVSAQVPQAVTVNATALDFGQASAGKSANSTITVTAPQGTPTR